MLSAAGFDLTRNMTKVKLKLYRLLYALALKKG